MNARNPQAGPVKIHPVVGAASNLVRNPMQPSPIFGGWGPRLR